MMDVIEHVDDDVALIRAYTDRMPRGSMVLVTVPAFQFLWSGHDVFLEHKRRYTRASLHRAIDRAGLKVIRSRYFFSVLLPVVCAIQLGGRLRLASSSFRPRSDLRVHSRWTNAALTAIHELKRHTLFQPARRSHRVLPGEAEIAPVDGRHSTFRTNQYLLGRSAIGGEPDLSRTHLIV